MCYHSDNIICIILCLGVETPQESLVHVYVEVTWDGINDLCIFFYDCLCFWQERIAALETENRELQLSKEVGGHVRKHMGKVC